MAAQHEPYTTSIYWIHRRPRQQPQISDGCSEPTVGGGWGLCSVSGHLRPSFIATTGDVWIIPSFRIWSYVLHVEHISCVITNCGQHPFSSLNNYLCLTGGKYCQKLLSLSWDLFFKILLFLVAFLYSFLLLYFSLLSSGWVIVAVCYSVSVQGTS